MRRILSKVCNWNNALRINNMRYGYECRCTDSGVIILAVEYKDDVRHGIMVLFQTNGNVHLKCMYANGELDGILVEFYYTDITNFYRISSIIFYYKGYVKKRYYM